MDDDRRKELLRQCEDLCPLCRGGDVPVLANRAGGQYALWWHAADLKAGTQQYQLCLAGHLRDQLAAEGTG